METVRRLCWRLAGEVAREELQLLREAACGYAGEAVIGFVWAPPRRGEREEREGEEIFGEGEH